MRRKSGSALGHQGPAATAGPLPDWDPVLVETLYALLYAPEPGSAGIESSLPELEQRFPGALYSELIHLLAHIDLEESEAKSCWRQILEHRDSMQRRLGGTVDVRVALVSYFLEVNRRLKNPKIIELKVFQQTQASAFRDDLTGLWNYRYFRDYLGREVDRGKRHSPPLSLVMADIDDFKDYNDRNGHESGNRALATVARLLTESLRSVDVAARYGGEEFALVLPSTSKTGAQRVAERSREIIERHAFSGDGTGAPLTVSMGVATFPADAREAGDLVRCADSALYAAKSRGKNQVHLYGQNRRSYRRISAALEGTFCVLAAEFHPLTTVDVSEGGLLFIADRSLPVGALIDVTLNLPDSHKRVATSGRVIRVEDRGGGRFEAAIRIIEMSSKDQGILGRYIREVVRNEESPASGAAGE